MSDKTKPVNVALTSSSLPAVEKKSTNQALYLLSGAISGAVSRSATAPIERIKVLQQVQSLSGTSAQYTGIVGSLRRIVREEGILGCWKGNGTNVIRVAPSAALRFATFELLKGLMLKPGETSLDTTRNFFAGAGAGLVSSVGSYPLDLLRSRLSAQTTSSKYKGLGHAIRVVFAEEGAAGFFRGVTTSVYGAVPYVALNFTFYETLKKRYLHANEGSKPSPLLSLSCGGVSGATAMTLTYSFELARRRMMVQGVDGRPVLYKSTLDAFRKIYAAEGFMGFYQGIWPNYFKVVPSMAIAFMTYEACKQAFGLK